MVRAWDRNSVLVCRTLCRPVGASADGRPTTGATRPRSARLLDAALAVMRRDETHRPPGAATSCRRPACRTRPSTATSAARTSCSSRARRRAAPARRVPRAPHGARDRSGASRCSAWIDGGARAGARPRRRRGDPSVRDQRRPARGDRFPAELAAQPSASSRVARARGARRSAATDDDAELIHDSRWARMHDALVHRRRPDAAPRSQHLVEFCLAGITGAR